MKKIELTFLIFSFSFLSIYAQTEPNPAKNKYEFNSLTLLKLDEVIKEDFNGDGKIDKAIFVTDKGKSGIKIIDGKTEEVTIIGLGHEFEEMGDDFSWVDYWGVVKDKTTFEIIIEDGEILGEQAVKLENPSLLLKKEDVGGGLLTFKEGKFVWIHQTD